MCSVFCCMHKYIVWRIKMNIEHVVCLKYLLFAYYYHIAAVIITYNDIHYIDVSFRLWQIFIQVNSTKEYILCTNYMVITLLWIMPCSFGFYLMFCVCRSLYNIESLNVAPHIQNIFDYYIFETLMLHNFQIIIRKKREKMLNYAVDKSSCIQYKSHLILIHPSFHLLHNQGMFVIEKQKLKNTKQSNNKN